MNHFRPVPKSGKQIAKDVLKAAGAEAVIGAVTMGVGGGQPVSPARARKPCSSRS